MVKEVSSNEKKYKRKFWEVTIENKLTWKGHMSQIQNRNSRYHEYSSKETLLSFIHISYFAIFCWKTVQLLDFMLQILQKIVLRIISLADFGSHSNPLLSGYHI